MLRKSENIIINGNSVIDGVEVMGFQATINSENPQAMSMNYWQINAELYKANRTQCRADQAEFEDYAYSVQDKMISEQAETAEE